MSNAAQIPLVELLRRVPSDRAISWETDWDSQGRSIGTSHAPVGRLMHEAADRIATLERELAEFAPFLKDGERPIERLKRERKDNDGLMTLLAKEKRRTEALTSELAEARKGEAVAQVVVCDGRVSMSASPTNLAKLQTMNGADLYTHPPAAGQDGEAVERVARYEEFMKSCRSSLERAGNEFAWSGSFPAVVCNHIDKTRDELSALRAEVWRQWQPIETAPKNTLIDIWIANKDGSGVRWTCCYYDSVCDQWRTSRPSGHLVTVKARDVSHWMPLPSEPLSASQAEKREG